MPLGDIHLIWTGLPSRSSVLVGEYLSFVACTIDFSYFFNVKHPTPYNIASLASYKNCLFNWSALNDFSTSLSSLWPQCAQECNWRRGKESPLRFGLFRYGSWSGQNFGTHMEFRLSSGGLWVIWLMYMGMYIWCKYGLSTLVYSMWCLCFFQ